MNYQTIYKTYRDMLPDFPALRRPRVGAVIKEKRVDKGIAQKDFAKHLGLNISTLKSIENDHQKATSVDNLEQCSKLLGMKVEEMILLGRERDPANFFVLKKEAPINVQGIRQRKRFPSEWHRTAELPFRKVSISPLSPPIATQRDFFLLRIEIQPLETLEDLKLPSEQKVVGFLFQGFNVEIAYAGTSVYPLTANQGFALNGGYVHSIRNNDEKETAILYLMTRLSETGRHPAQNLKMEPTKERSIEISKAIHAVRKFKSERSDRLVSIRHLADLTDSLDHEQLAKLMRLKKGSSVIYWEKIEDLLAGTHVSMEDFLAWSRKNPPPFFSRTTSSTRAIMDYSTYHGLKIYSAVPPLTQNEFFCGELLVEGRSAAGHKPWERKDHGMILIYVEDGELEITVGKSRSPLPLLKGESIYFDGSLGYLLRNPAAVQSRAFFAAYPGIQV